MRGCHLILLILFFFDNDVYWAGQIRCKLAHVSNHAAAHVTWELLISSPIPWVSKRRFLRRLVAGWTCWVSRTMWDYVWKHA